jgi:hypothetical protein
VLDLGVSVLSSENGTASHESVGSQFGDAFDVRFIDSAVDL